MIARSLGGMPSKYFFEPVFLVSNSLETLLPRTTVTIGKSLLGSNFSSVHVSFLSENFLPLIVFSVSLAASEELLSRKASLPAECFSFSSFGLSVLTGGGAGGGTVAALRATSSFFVSCCSLTFAFASASASFVGCC